MNADAELVEHLDAFVSDLRAGRVPDPTALLARRPDAAPLLRCLEDLNLLARAANRGDSSDIAATQEAPTLPGADAAPDIELGPPRSRFGKFELLELVGQGGMGVVYKARQTDLDRIVAVKMILASRFASPEQVARFEAEARAAAGLRHPHVLRVFEAGRLDGQHYFAMEFVDGPSLARVARRGALPPDEAARCLRDVARAVAYLHSRGIVHRDLKPGNILLDAEGLPYVTDFGLAKVLSGGSDLTASGAVLGTPTYMAPEQAASRHADVGPKSDVYSLGAILYELLTGRPPFHEATPLDTLVQVLEGEPALPTQVNPRVPREVELICLKAMAKAPEDRYDSAAALADDLDRFLLREPVAARRQSARQTIVRWARQEPGLACRLAAVGAAALVAQLYYQLEHPVSLQAHTEVMLVLATWAGISLLCQALIRRQFSAERVRALWLAADGALLTTALLLDEAYSSPLLLSYATYIVASGLWFRVGWVWLAAVIAVLGYALLIAVGASQGKLGQSPQHHAITMAALVIVAVMVAAQVRRVRALSQYYGHRPLP